METEANRDRDREKQNVLNVLVPQMCVTSLVEFQA